MTPNPHPAVSGNGDVIERLRNQGKSGTLSIRFTQRLLNEAAAEIERLRGLLKLSEGSGDGKMLEALNRARFMFVSLHQQAEERGLLNFTALWQERCRNGIEAIDEALATPAPSPIDAAGMRGACANAIEKLNDEDLPPENTNQYAEGYYDALEAAHRAILALPTPAPEIDRERLARAIVGFEMVNRAVPRACDYQLADYIIERIGGRHV